MHHAIPAMDIARSCDASSMPAAYGAGEFIMFFRFQCERLEGLEDATEDGNAAADLNRTAGSSKSLVVQRHQHKPTRSLLKLLGQVEPLLFRDIDVADSDAGATVALDLSTHFLGAALVTALLRALTLFVPESAAQRGSGSKLTLNVHELNLKQNGLSNESCAALCELLLSGRCRVLRRVVLDRNEYLAVEAGQMLLRAFGVGGPLGDGNRGQSYAMLAPHHRATDESSPAADGTTGGVLAIPLAFSDVVPCLEAVSVEGTNIPAHFARRIADAVALPKRAV